VGGKAKLKLAIIETPVGWARVLCPRGSLHWQPKEVPVVHKTRAHPTNSIKDGRNKKREMRLPGNLTVTNSPFQGTFIIAPALRVVVD